MRVIEGKRIHIKLWADPIEESAMEQIYNLSDLPFAFHHIAIMPDCHTGYGVPIGGVLATNDVVIPHAVGVDVGCGVCSLRFDLKAITTEQVKAIMGKIREKVPVGFNHHDSPQEWQGFAEAPAVPIIQQELNAARKQLGTLGGGNHFCEIQKGDDGFIYAMIHSGSRNFGLKIANKYDEIATWYCQKWYSAIPEIKGKDGLAFLPIEMKEAKEYMEAMQYALRFARENRRLMMDRVVQSFVEVIPDLDYYKSTLLDVHHNYAAWEHHFGKNVIVHRKGATSAQKGEWGIIPGSQGTSSYIVKGLGSADSFTSCSHGAGRKMSRNVARKLLVLDEEKKKMDDLGIVHAIRTTSDLDEASSAYKDIDQVMAQQTDLVEIVTKLTPLGVIKG